MSVSLQRNATSPEQSWPPGEARPRPRLRVPVVGPEQADEECTFDGRPDLDKEGAVLADEHPDAFANAMRLAVRVGQVRAEISNGWVETGR